MAYYMDTTEKLREIFTEHCNLSMEQYEEISSRLINLVTDIQMLEEKSDEVTPEGVEQAAEELGVIFEFLLNTKELTLKEYNELCNLANALADAAREAAQR